MSNDSLPLVIANWKMKLGLQESHTLAQSLASQEQGNAQLVLCPSFPSILPVSEALHGTNIALGAQDCFWESRGAYTGEVSVDDLVELGCKYVIIGHSERREHLGETNIQVHKKVHAALEVGLTPIICIGETFEQRTNGARDYIIIDQLTNALDGLTFTSTMNIIVAYEPVWVIGSGQAINPSQAQEAHQILHQTVVDVAGSTFASRNVRIVYGGSVDERNVKSFIRLEHTSGVLVGGASLQAEELMSIVNAC